MSRVTYRRILIGLFAVVLWIAACGDSFASGSASPDTGIWNGVLERSLVAGVAFILLIPVAAAIAASKDRARKAAQTENIDDSDQGDRAHIYGRPTRSMKWGVVSFMIAALVLIGGFTVWPTTYRYDSMAIGGSVYPVRIHRITGESERLTPRGWQPLGQHEQKHTVELPEAELAKLDGNASFFDNKLSCTIYNGSTYRINEIIVTLTNIQSDSDLWSGLGIQVGSPLTRTAVPPPPWELVVFQRDYRLKDILFIDPLETGVLRQDVGFQPDAGQKWSWRIKSAKGIRQ